MSKEGVVGGREKLRGFSNVAFVKIKKQEIKKNNHHSFRGFLNPCCGFDVCAYLMYSISSTTGSRIVRLGIIVQT